MKRVLTLLGALALVASLSTPASVKAAPVSKNITWGESIIWGGFIGDNITWGETVLPAGTLIGYSVASSNSVYVWAWVPGAATPVIIGEQAIWGT
jgi:hypothetical protein